MPNQEMNDKLLDKTEIIGVLLAGGQGRRMRKTLTGVDPRSVDKCLMPLGQRPLIHHVITRAAPQVSRLLLNTNSDPKRFKDFPLTIVQDIAPGNLGPLIGILSAMKWIHEHRPHCQWLASFATDSPFFPLNMVARLLQTATTKPSLLSSVKSAHHTHPVFALWSVSLYEELRTFILKENRRKMHEFFSQHGVSWIDFPSRGIDPFFNINTAEDLAKAENLIPLPY